MSFSSAQLPARREARVVAAAIDAAVLALTALPFVALAGLVVLLQTDWLAVDPSGSEWALGYVLAALWLLVPPAYFAAGARYGTPGARRMALRVVDETGGAPAWPRAGARGLLVYPSLLGLGVGVWLPLLNGRGRGFADLVTRTRTIEVAGDRDD